MSRKLVWVESQKFQGWGCSECAWVFNPSGPVVGRSIDEMKTHYEQQRDKEFTSHVCAAPPTAAKNAS
jgi:rubredoxin